MPVIENTAAFPSKEMRQTAAHLALTVAQDFNAAADGADIARLLPMLAVHWLRAGQTVDADHLRAAAAQGRAHLESLLEKRPAANTKQTLTYQAVRAGLLPPAVKKLFQMPVPNNCPAIAYERAVVTCGISHETLILNAAIAGHLPIIKWMGEFFCRDYYTLGEALRRAAENGHLPVVEWLYAQNVNHRAKDDAALRRAAANGHLPVVQWLHDHGADLSVANHEAMAKAAGAGHLAVVEWIYKHNPDAQAGLIKTFHHAAVNGQLHVLDWLYGQGFDVKQQPERTLIETVYEGQDASVAWLEAHGMDLSVLNSLHLRQLVGHFHHIGMLGWLQDKGLAGSALLDPDHHDKLARWRRAAPEWQRRLHIVLPSGLEEYSPAGIEPATFRAVQRWLKQEKYDGSVGNQFAYQLSALFTTEDRILRYLQKWGGPKSHQPLHDVSYMIKVPQDGAFDAKAWGYAALKFGPEMAGLVKFASRLPQPLATLNATREAVAQFGYPRGNEHPALAALCLQHKVEEDAFDKALTLYLKQKAKNFPPKNIPDLRIDGASFGLPGAVFRRLAPDDVRGLLLGELTDCCQSIGKLGAMAAEHGFTSENGGFYVVETEDDEIIGQSWAWRGRREELVLDSLETLGGRVTKDQWQTILQQAVMQLTDYKKHRVSALRVGTGGATPQGMKFVRAMDPAKPKDHGGYGDSRQQYEIMPTVQPHPRLENAPGP